MKRIELVISVERARKLKELGVTVDSYFGWEPFCEGNMRIGDWFEENMDHSLGALHAYTVAELGYMLPDDKNEVYLCEKNLTTYMHRYSTRHWLIDSDHIADVIIHGLEARYWSLEEVNGC